MRLGAFAASCGRKSFLVIVCVLFSACHPAQEKAGPLIEFTKIPRAGEGNPYKVAVIEGRVIGARAGQQIVLYARSGAWWVQPLADQPYTKIQPDSTWRNSTHPGTQYAALLVDPGYHPPAITIVLPGAGGAVAAVATVKGKPFFWQTWWFRAGLGIALLALAFDAYRWRVRNIEERERQFRRLAENAPDIVTRLDADLRYTYVNPIVEEYTGLPPEALLGKTSHEVGLFEKNAQSWEAGLLQVFSTGQATMKEFSFNTPKGKRYFESRLVPEFGSDGSAKSVLAVTRDITDRKRAEETLRRSEAYLAEAQRLTHSGSWAWNVRTGDAFWSQEMFRILGDDPHKTKATLSHFLEKVHPEDRPLIEQKAKAESAGLENVDAEADYRIVLADGTIRHLHSVARPVKNESGEVVEIVGTTMDVTERKIAEQKMLEAREALRQAQAELARVNRVMLVGETAASIAHEVNQPIAATVTNASAGLRWLAAQPPDLEEARQALGRIVKDGNRAGEVVGRIRALVKKFPPLKDRLDINQTILEAIRLTETEVHDHHISLQTQLSNDLSPILGDRIQLQQVILNLIKNAVEAMSAVSDGPRELLVSSGRDGSRGVLVAVRDTGPGFDPKALAHLFDTFYTTKPEGMGMGLAISRSIIEAHGGRLWAAPNEPHGAAFQFTLPTDGDRMP
jgi:PAS domain S-box-containing protein